MFRILLMLALALAPSLAMADPLASLSGKKNAILLFSKSRSDAQVDRMLSMFQERRAELEERSVIVITVFGDRDAIAALGYASLPAGANRDLRSRFKPEIRGATVVLVAKDGTEAGRWQGIVQPDALIEALDALPATKDEARPLTGSG